MKVTDSGPAWARPGVVVVAAVAAAGLWPLLWARRYGGLGALVAVGPEGPAFHLVHRELPAAHLFPGPGHDGQQYYAIARAPFAFHTTARYLDYPGYRMRRILFPFLAHLVAPGGGTALVVALLCLSLGGVALGSWALTRLPGAPWWLPLTMVANPGVVASMMLSLSDALSTGFVLAAFASGFRRRWVLAIACVTLAGLTRETSLLACLALCAVARAPRWFRVGVVAVPSLALGVWLAVLRVGLRGVSHQQMPTRQLVGWPLAGWIHGAWNLGDRAMTLPVVAVMVVAVARRPPSLRPVTIFLSLTLALLAVASTAATQHWLDSSRVVAPTLPLACWALARRPAMSRPAAVPAPATA